MGEDRLSVDIEGAGFQLDSCTGSHEKPRQCVINCTPCADYVWLARRSGNCRLATGISRRYQRPLCQRGNPRTGGLFDPHRASENRLDLFLWRHERLARTAKQSLLPAPPKTEPQNHSGAMRLNLRFVFSLLAVLSLASMVFSYVQFRTEKQALRQDLRKRAQVLAESLSESIEPALAKGSRRDLQRIVERFGDRERLAGIAVYDTAGTPITMTARLNARFPGVNFMPTLPAEVRARGPETGEFRILNGTRLYIYPLQLSVGEKAAGTVWVVHDSGYINAQSQSFWRKTFLRVSVEMFLIALTALVIIRLSISDPVAKTVQWMKALRTGKAPPRQSSADGDIFTPLR